MTDARYTPPSAKIADPQTPRSGPLHWFAAITLAVILAQVLVTVVAETVVLAVVDVLALDIDNERSLFVALGIDIAISFGFNVAAIHLGARVASSRQTTVLWVTAVALGLITFAWRWLMNDYGWPLWYEGVLLLLPLLAAGLLAVTWHRAAASDA